ncbi:hypothetical protein L1887_02931 [Cichorium endivia]|nr:hypothetical protein L1887_02931 [Cichorium endivia]
MHTLRSPQKLLLRHRNRNSDLNDSSEELLTLHSEEQLPFCPKRGYIGIKSFEFPSKRGFNNFIGSCNGILCLFNNRENSISLWNPSIRHKLTVPRCSDQKYSTWIAMGFGFDPITDDYKIVSIPFYRKYRGKGESSYVYTLKTGAWCAIASPMPLFSELASWPCFVNGAFHWMVQVYSNVSRDVDARRILTFDLSTQVFGMIPLPDSGPKYKQPTIYQASLAVIAMDADDDYRWIWVRRDASWSLVTKLKKNQVGGRIHEGLQSTNNGDSFIQANNGFRDHYLLATLSKLAGFNAASHVFDIVFYAESLQLLNIGTIC